MGITFPRMELLTAAEVAVKYGAAPELPFGMTVFVTDATGSDVHRYDGVGDGTPAETSTEFAGGDGALHNFAATMPPAASNDDTEGYEVGSRWIDVTNDESWVCVDASTGAAAWEQTTVGTIAEVAGLQSALDDKAAQTALDAHAADTANPHSVTQTQVGLGNVDNTSDADKPVSTAQQAALGTKQKTLALHAFQDAQADSTSSTTYVDMAVNMSVDVPGCVIGDKLDISAVLNHVEHNVALGQQSVLFGLTLTEPDLTETVLREFSASVLDVSDGLQCVMSGVHTCGQAGSHNVKVQWKVNSGTGQLLNNADGAGTRVLKVLHVPA